MVGRITAIAASVGIKPHLNGGVFLCIFAYYSGKRI
jgi:hypothetical protein